MALQTPSWGHTQSHCESKDGGSQQRKTFYVEPSRTCHLEVGTGYWTLHDTATQEARHLPLTNT